MANEISFLDLETHAGLAHYLSGVIHTNLYDRLDIRALLDRKEFKANMGSDTVKTTRVTRGQVFADTTTELDGGSPSNQDIGDSSFDLTVARKIMKWTVSDLWRIVGASGSIDLDLLAQIIVEATGLKLTDMVCALFASLSNSVGSATEQMKVDFAFDAQFKLNNARADATGAAIVLAPHPHNKFVESLRSEGGAIQYVLATAEQLKAKGPNYKGSWNGFEIICSDSVTLDGGSTFRRNAAFASGCFAYCEAPVPEVADALPAEQRAIVDGIVRIVHTFDAENGTTSIIGDYYPAVAEQEDARGVLINTLAA